MLEMFEIGHLTFTPTENAARSYGALQGALLVDRSYELSIKLNGVDPRVFRISIVDFLSQFLYTMKDAVLLPGVVRTFIIMEYEETVNIRVDGDNVQLWIQPDPSEVVTTLSFTNVFSKLLQKLKQEVVDAFSENRIKATANVVCLPFYFNKI
jgi:hypothetical protein